MSLMKWTLTVAALSTLAAMSVSAQNAPAGNPLAGNADAIRFGMGLYRARCADCHGMDARGVRAPDITQVWAPAGPTTVCSKRVKNGVPGTEMPAVGPRMFDHETWQILAYLRTLAAPAPTDPPSGNAENGQRVFRANCAGCHRVNGTGGRLGPDLSRVGSARTRDVIVQADPRRHRRLPPGLRTGHAHAEPTDRPIHGVKKNEDLFSVQIMDTRERIQGYREGQDEDGRQRHEVGDAHVRSRSSERKRSRRSAFATCRRSAASIPRSSHRRGDCMRTTITRLGRVALLVAPLGAVAVGATGAASRKWRFRKSSTDSRPTARAG